MSNLNYKLIFEADTQKAIQSVLSMTSEINNNILPTIKPVVIDIKPKVNVNNFTVLSESLSKEINAVVIPIKPKVTPQDFDSVITGINTKFQKEIKPIKITIDDNVNTAKLKEEEKVVIESQNSFKNKAITVKESSAIILEILANEKNRTTEFLNATASAMKSFTTDRIAEQVAQTATLNAETKTRIGLINAETRKLNAETNSQTAMLRAQAAVTKSLTDDRIAETKVKIGLINAETKALTAKQDAETNSLKANTAALLAQQTAEINKQKILIVESIREKEKSGTLDSAAVASIRLQTEAMQILFNTTKKVTQEKEKAVSKPFDFISGGLSTGKNYDAIKKPDNTVFNYATGKIISTIKEVNDFNVSESLKNLFKMQYDYKAHNNAMAILQRRAERQNKERLEREEFDTKASYNARLMSLSETYAKMDAIQKKHEINYQNTINRVTGVSASGYQTVINPRGIETQRPKNDDYAMRNAMYASIFTTVIDDDIKKLAKLAEANKKASRSQKELTQSTREQTNAFTELNSWLSRSHDMLIRMAAYRAINFLANVPADILRVNIEMESLMLRLEGITGSAEKAKKQFDDLLTLDLQTQFDIEGLATASTMMQNYGLTVQSVTEHNKALKNTLTTNADVLSIFADQTARLGGSTDTLTGIVRQFSQAWAKGKLQMQDARPMIERGVNVWDYAARAVQALETEQGRLNGTLTGTQQAIKRTTSDMLEMSRAGTLNKDAMAKMLELMRVDFAGESLKQMDRLGGSLSNIKTGMIQLYDNMLDQAAAAKVSSGFQSIGTAILFLADSLKSTSRSAQIVFDFMGNSANVLFAVLGVKLLSSVRSYTASLIPAAQQSRNLALAQAGLATQTRTVAFANATLTANTTLATRASGAFSAMLLPLSRNLGLVNLATKALSASVGLLTGATYVLLAYDIGKFVFDWALQFDVVRKSVIYAKTAFQDLFAVLNAVSKIDFKELGKETGKAVANLPKNIFDFVFPTAQADDFSKQQTNYFSNLFTQIFNDANAQIDEIHKNARREIELAPTLSTEQFKNKFTDAKDVATGEMEEIAYRNKQMVDDIVEKWGNIKTFNIDKKVAKELQNLDLTGVTIKDLPTEISSLIVANGRNLAQGSFAEKQAIENAMKLFIKKGITAKETENKIQEELKRTFAIQEGLHNRLMAQLKAQHELRISNIEFEQRQNQRAFDKGKMSFSQKYTSDITTENQIYKERIGLIKDELRGIDDLIARYKEYNDFISKEPEIANSSIDLLIDNGKRYTDSNEFIKDGEAALTKQKELTIELQKLENEHRNQIISIRQSRDDSLESYKNNISELRIKYAELTGNTAQAVVETAKLKSVTDDLLKKATANKENSVVEMINAINTIDPQLAGIQEKIKYFGMLEYQINLATAAEMRNMASKGVDAQGQPLTDIGKTALTNEATKRENLGYAQKALIDKELTSPEALLNQERALADINKEWVDMSLNISNVGDAFNFMNEGIGGVLSALNTAMTGYAGVRDEIEKNVFAMKDVDEQVRKNQLTEKQAIERKAGYAKIGEQLNRKEVALSIQGTRQITGAFGNMFAENSKARKAFHILDMTLGAVELANNIANNGALMASNLIAIGSNLAVGASKIWSQMGIFAPIGLAAMAASMGAWMIGNFTGGGSARMPEQTKSTGTVLGDSEASSDSINRIVSTLKDIHADEYPELRGIHSSMTALANSLQTTVNRGFTTGQFNTPSVDTSMSFFDKLKYQFLTPAALGEMAMTSAFTGLVIPAAVGAAQTAIASSVITAATTGTTTMATSFLPLLGLDPTGIGLIAGGILFGLNMLFSDVETGIEKQQLVLRQKSLGGIQSGGVSGVQETGLRTVVSGLFWDSVYRKTVTQSLNKEFTSALTDVFNNAGNTVKQLGSALGTDLTAQVNSYVIPEIRLDVLNKKGEDISKELTQIMSATLDNMTNQLLGGLVGQYQRVGEGIMETAARVAIDVAVVKDALSTSQKQLTQNAIAISEAIVSAFGGAAELANVVSSFRDNFYTDAEKQAYAYKTLSESFKEVYRVVPATREEYKKLVDSFDVTTEWGRKQWTVFMQLNSVADQYYDTLKDGLSVYENAVKDTFGEVEKIWQDIVSSIKSEYDSVNSLATAQINKYKQIEDSLKAFSVSLLANNSMNPMAEYYAKQAQFNALQRDIEGTDKEKKDAALAQLPTVGQAFLTSSQSIYKGGVEYLKDFAKVNALTAQGINYASASQKTLTDSLKDITDALTEKGILSKNITDVSTAISNLQIKIESLDSTGEQFKQAQEIAIKTGLVATNTNTLNTKITELTTAIGKFDTAVAQLPKNTATDATNYAAFQQYELTRRQQYDSAKYSTASGFASKGSAINTSMGGASGIITTSKAYGGAAQFNSSTGSSSSLIKGWSHSGAGVNIPSAIDSRVNILGTNLFSIISNLKSAGLTGTVPNFTVEISQPKDYGSFNQPAPFFIYKIGNYTKSTKDINDFANSFADNVIDILASQFPNQTVADKLKSMPIGSVDSALSEVSKIIYDYKNPFKQGTYNKDIDYLKLDGSHASGLDFVPYDGYIAELHKGERVLTERENSIFNSLPFNSSNNSDNSELIKLLAEINKKLEELKALTKSQNDIVTNSAEKDRFGYMKQIELLETMTTELSNKSRDKRIANVN